MNVSTKKTCCYCKETKPLEAFRLSGRTKDGRHTQCRECLKKKLLTKVSMWRKERLGKEPPKNKKCSRCKAKKKIEFFARDAFQKDGFCLYCKDCLNPRKAEYQKRFHEKNPEKKSEASRRVCCWRLGITVNDYYALVKKQKGRCLICKKPPSGKPRDKHLHIDHCHKSKKVRALLCGNCNRAIGLFKDSPKICEAAARYLRGS